MIAKQTRRKKDCQMPEDELHLLLSCYSYKRIVCTYSVISITNLLVAFSRYNLKFARLKSVLQSKQKIEVIIFKVFKRYEIKFICLSLSLSTVLLLELILTRTRHCCSVLKQHFFFISIVFFSYCT
jgi:hypothetical protein